MPSRRSQLLRRLGLRALVFWGVAVLIVAVALLLWYERHVWFVAFTGILLAIFLESLARGFCGYTHIPYGWSLTIMVLLLLAVAGSLGWLTGARIADQIAELARELPASLDKLRAQMENTVAGKAIDQAAPKAAESLLSKDTLAQAAGIAAGTFESLVDVIVVAFVGLYGAAQPDWYLRGVLHLVPSARRNRIRDVFGQIAGTVRWWLLGQLLAMIVTGVLVGLGMWLIGMRLPWALGVLAFLLEIVPYVGPLLSLVPATLLAWTVGPWMVLWVLAVFAVVHIVEGYIVMPIVQVRTIHLPPALHVLAVLLLTRLGGVLGILVAAPLVITLTVLVRALYVEDVLNDHGAAASGANE